VAALRGHGCEVLTVPAESVGRSALLPLFAEFGRRRWTNVLIEGGAAVLGSFFDARLIDEVHVFIAPTLVGGGQSLTPVGGVGVATMADAQQFRGWHVEQIDSDVYWRGWMDMAE
jgi:diaminohydroxyphosphoribosylaminopyrimidine deaminase/5-amino-6-(5-phosphoribosylamino)uracil reductase